MSRIDFPKIYNPANQTAQELIENFVVRTKIFKEIFNDIKSSKMEYPEQHYIVQGVRGQGKTTLLLRIAYEINNTKTIRKRVIPIIFNEEQYNISRLFKLWETVAEYLEEDGELHGLYDEMQKLEMDADYEQRCFQILENGLKKHKKKAILFIDNIDEILNKFSKKEHHRLREIFIESAEIRVIGASSVSLEFHYDYGKPLYQFFRMPQLRGLNHEETQTLLLKLGERYKGERVKVIVEHQPGRIEALRRLTGGVIRTIVLLFEIFVDDTNGNAFLDLEKILDGVTPLYKHRMEKLSPQQQEIVDFIALRWDAVSAREIAQKTKLESKAVSSQLKQLQRYHIIDKESTNTKNFLYRISERFFNIWYLMRLGRKWDEKRVRFLVEFLQIWCDEKELEKRATKHLEGIRKGKLYDKQALYITEALARTPIRRELQHELIRETRSYFEKTHSDLKEYLCRSDYELEKLASTAMKGKDFQLAIQHIENIKVKEPNDLNTLGLAYLINKEDYRQAKNFFLQAVKKGHSGAMYNLGLLYQTEFKDFEKAEKYYLMAVKKGYSGAMNNLGLLYQTEFKDFKKAEKYYLMAVEKGDSGAMHNLGSLYQTEFKDFEKAKNYYLMAVKKDHSVAMSNLGALYQTEFKDFKKAEKYYLMAVEKGDLGAMHNLGALYQTEFKNFEKAENYYLMAVEKGLSGAMNNLGWLYQTEFKDFEKAENYYLMAVEKGLSEAMNNLGWLYQTEFKDFEKAENYYLMAVEKGLSGAIYNLGVLYQTEFKDTDKAEEYYLMAVEQGLSEAIYNLGCFYSTEFKDFKKAEKYYLMAVKKGHSRAMSNLGALYQAEFKDFKKAEKYYLMAVEKGESGAMHNLGGLYQIEFKDFKKAEKYYLMAVEKGHSVAMSILAALYQTKFKDFEKAEKYYLMAVEKGDSNAMSYLGWLYQTEFNDFKKAENYYSMAVEKGDFGAMNNLGGLYQTEFKDFKKAEKYYLMAAEKGDFGAMNNLAWIYFKNRKQKEKSLQLAKTAYKENNDISNTHTYATILLWHDDIKNSYSIAMGFLENRESYEKFPEDIGLFFMLLIAKKQYHLTFKIFNENPYNLKDRFKPIYYALMYFMQDEYPNEYRKMGGELKQTVEEIIEKIGQLEKDYA